MKPIYLDYAATTPVRPEVIKAMEPYFSVNFGNPGSTHYFGQKAVGGLDAARARAADLLGTAFRGVVFTGSATEADNLALRGAVSRYLETNRRDSALPVRVIISGGEHEAVRKTAEALSEEGAEVVELPLDKTGRANPDDLKKTINERTAIVSIIHTSNETGAINDIAAFAAITGDQRSLCREKFGADHHYPLLHTDAVQGFGTNEINFSSTEADLITLSAHKIGGPKGVGILAMAEEFARGNNVRILNPVITGGDQEFNLRAGTENTLFIEGMVSAMEITAAERQIEAKRLREIKEKFIGEIVKIMPTAQVNGGLDIAAHSPHIINIWFPGENSEDLLTRFDLAGVSASYGSACKARSFEPSKTLRAIYGPERSRSSLRFSFGKETTPEKIAEAIRIIREVLK